MDINEKKSKKKKIESPEKLKVPKKKKKIVMEDEVLEENFKHEDVDVDIDHTEDGNIATKDTETEEVKLLDTWTSEDYMELIKRIELQIPKDDHLSFPKRAERLDWEQIKFGNHSVEECYDKWKLLRSKVRHFRILSEILQDAKVWALTPWSAPLNKKKTRHPEQPPRPLTSFMLYYMEKKSKIMKKNPDLKLTDISRLVADKFNALPEEKKAYYIEKSKEMQEEYKQNLAKFYEKHPEMMKVSKKPLAQTNRPLPPIKLYLREKLAKHQKDENFNQHDCIEKYKEMWKNLSYKKKAFWIRLAKEEEEKYLEHLHEEEGDDNKPATSYKSVISKEEHNILDRLAGKPEKPPNSAYSLFSRLMLQDKETNFVDEEPKKRMKEVAIMWKELPEEKKKVYAERVQHMTENYKLEMANYLDTLPEEKRAEELAKLQPKKKTTTRVRRKPVKKAEVMNSLGSDDGEELWKNEPKKPPVTAWDLFKTEFVKKNSHLPSKAAFKQAAAEWKTLSKKELEKYQKRHKKLKDKYMIDFEQFLTTLNEDELKEYSAWKKAKSGQALNDESLEEESSEEEEDEGEEENDDEVGNSSSVPSSSSDESDSGVSEEGA